MYFHFAVILSYSPLFYPIFILLPYKFIYLLTIHYIAIIETFFCYCLIPSRPFSKNPFQLNLNSIWFPASVHHLLRFLFDFHTSFESLTFLLNYPSFIINIWFEIFIILELNLRLPVKISSNAWPLLSMLLSRWQARHWLKYTV